MLKNIVCLAAKTYDLITERVHYPLLAVSGKLYGKLTGNWLFDEAMCNAINTAKKFGMAPSDLMVNQLCWMFQSVSKESSTLDFVRNRSETYNNYLLELVKLPSTHVD